MEFTINLSGRPFNLDYTLNSGQVFRWQKRGQEWEGIVLDSFVKIRQEADLLFCKVESGEVNSSYISRYLRLDEDLSFILGNIARDETIVGAIRRFYGLRLIRQDPWECLISFILATNANIQRISKMIDSLCKRYGKPLQTLEGEKNSFPTPETLSNAKEEELRKLGLGYRARYIVSVSKSIASGIFSFEELTEMSYLDARDSILREFERKKILPGVGNKVADCVLLFSLGKDEAFPIDVWILKAIKAYYQDICKDVIQSGKLSNKQYIKLSDIMRKYFGKYAGYAQQYLYVLSRSEL